MSPTADELIDGLRREGLRVTRPRRAVCQVLGSITHGHLTAGDLQDQAEKVAGTSIDLSTIYRTIDALEKAGMIHHVHLGHGPSVLHLSERLDHHHLVCEVCGRTEDLPLEELERLVGHVEERYGFIADSVHFALVGRCAAHGEATTTDA